MNDKKLKFSQIPGGLYARKLEQNSNSRENSNKNNDDEFIKLKDTQQSYLAVKHNCEFLSNRQIKKAQEVK